MQKNTDLIQNPLDSQVKSSNIALNSFNRWYVFFACLVNFNLIDWNEKNKHCELNWTLVKGWVFLEISQLQYYSSLIVKNFQGEEGAPAFQGEQRVLHLFIFYVFDKWTFWW
jgi:hypothetical protein